MTYKVAVESGSCSMDYKYWEERIECGHAHKTIEAAKACMARLTQWYCNHGHLQGTRCAGCLGTAQGHSTSAVWYNATIHTHDGQRVGR